MFFHCWAAVLDFTDLEEVSDTSWKHHHDEIFEGLRKISSSLSEIEWFSKRKKVKTTALRRAILGMRADTINFSNNRDIVLNAIKSPLLKDIKENALALSNADDYYMQEIIKDYDKIQQELAMMEVSPCQPASHT